MWILGREEGSPVSSQTKPSHAWCVPSGIIGHLLRAEPQIRRQVSDRKIEVTVFVLRLWGGRSRHPKGRRKGHKYELMHSLGSSLNTLFPPTRLSFCRGQETPRALQTVLRRLPCMSDLRKAYDLLEERPVIPARGHSFSSGRGGQGRCE